MNMNEKNIKNKDELSGDNLFHKKYGKNNFPNLVEVWEIENKEKYLTLK